MGGSTLVWFPADDGFNWGKTECVRMFIETGSVCKLTGCLETSVWWNKVLCWAVMAVCFVAAAEDPLRFSGLSTFCSCMSCIYSSKGVKVNFYVFLSAEAKYSKIK